MYLRENLDSSHRKKKMEEECNLGSLSRARYKCRQTNITSQPAYFFAFLSASVSAFLSSVPASFFNFLCNEKLKLFGGTFGFCVFVAGFENFQ